MLIDVHLPRFHYQELHRIYARASPARVYAAIRETRLRSSLVSRSLMFLRVLPSLSVGQQARSAPILRVLGNPQATLSSFVESGFFAVLDEREPEELVLGLVGRFWTLSTSMRPTRAEDFDDFAEPGYAKGAMGFRVQAHAGGRTELVTETRVLCTDTASQRRFGRYWWMIRPWSGLIRHDLLRAVKRHAERPHPHPSAA